MSRQADASSGWSIRQNVGWNNRDLAETPVQSATPRHPIWSNQCEIFSSQRSASSSPEPPLRPPSKRVSCPRELLTISSSSMVLLSSPATEGTAAIHPDAKGNLYIDPKVFPSAV